MHRIPIGKPGKSKGFTLIEMLVALVIFVIGLMAVGLLQLRGLTMTRDANLRSTAIYGMQMITNAIKSNFAVQYTYDSSAPPAAVTPCNVAMAPGVSNSGTCLCDVADNDLVELFTAIQALPNPTGGLNKVRIRRLAVTSIALDGTETAFAENTGPVPQHRLAPISCQTYESTPWEVTISWSEGGGTLGVANQSLTSVVIP